MHAMQGGVASFGLRALRHLRCGYSAFGRGVCNPLRSTYCSQPPSSPPSGSPGTALTDASGVIINSLGAKKLGLDAELLAKMNTQKEPIYTLPYYGANEDTIASLSDTEVKRALRLHGGLIKRWDTAATLRMRLLRATRADYRKKQLTMEGVVVSNRMNKSVVIAARRRAYASKLRLHYWKTRRFMAHDELDLCREGDRVVIRYIRPLSKRKFFVVVQNYGDPTYIGEDQRAEAVRSAAEDGVGLNEVNEAESGGSEDHETESDGSEDDTADGGGVSGEEKR